MKPKTFTQSMSWLHTWCGLLLGWVLFAIFLTGTIAVFDKELNWWMQPELVQSELDQAAATRTAQRWLETNHPQAESWNISLPTERTPALAVSTGEQRRGERTYLNPYSGEVLEPRETAGGNFFFRFHFTLHMPRMLGIWLVGFAAMAMLVALIGGIVIHKKIFKEFFTFRPGKGQRSWLDGHNASGVLLLPFHLMITYTGLVIFLLIYMPAALDALYDGDRNAMFRDGRSDAAQQQDHRGQGRGDRRVQAATAELRPLEEFIAKAEAHYGPGTLSGLSIANPGRTDARVTARPLLGSRIELTKGEGMTFSGVTGELLQAPPPSRASLLTQRVMAGLHFAQFGGYPMRWLYFICGLISCAMIATGLVHYTVKQRRQAKGSRHFLRVAESLNVATVAGLSLACGALLWANRLLPVELVGRGEWEVRLFFGTWLLTLLHASVRPPLNAWREQLYAAALLALALPVLDILNATGMPDGIRLGVDVGAAALGLLLGWIAWRIPTQPVSSKATRTAALPATGVGQ
ncbi:MAG: PepSY-associated TM helix domain-containing protein [Pseudomonas sp.]